VTQCIPEYQHWTNGIRYPTTGPAEGTGRCRGRFVTRVIHDLAALCARPQNRIKPVGLPDDMLHEPVTHGENNSEEKRLVAG